MKKIIGFIKENSSILTLGFAIGAFYWMSYQKNVELEKLKTNNEVNNKLTEIDSYMEGFIDGSEGRSMKKKTDKILNQIERKIK